VIFEGDAIATMRALQAEEANPSRVGRIFDEEKSYLQNFIKWDVTHIGRKGNRVAHCSARYVKKIK
jgi:hypothetical protein